MTAAVRATPCPLAVPTTAAAFAALALAHLSLGPAQIAAADLTRALAFDPVDPAHHEIVWLLRAPRVVAALLAGAMLGLAGAILQALTRNPLADPGLTGVTGGAVLAMAAGGLAGLDPAGLARPAAGLAGGLAAGAVVLALSAPGRSGAPVRLVLTGVLVGGACSALTAAGLLAADETLARDILFWTVGSTHGLVWDHVAALTPFAALGLAAGLAAGRTANALSLGDGAARGIGVPVGVARAALLAAAALLTAGAVATVGGVGFLGLIAPHLARRIVGGDARALFPAAAAAGALLLGLADLAARLAELGWIAERAGLNLPGASGLPAGAVAALMGAPFFLLLLLRGDAP